jgi:hypothetical protein
MFYVSWWYSGTLQSPVILPRRFIEGSNCLLITFLQMKDGFCWDKYMALLIYVVVVATAIETNCKYPLLDLCYLRYIFKVRQHESNESNNHCLRNVVQNISMWYTLDDPESCQLEIDQETNYISLVYQPSAPSIDSKCLAFNYRCCVTCVRLGMCCVT